MRKPNKTASPLGEAVFLLNTTVARVRPQPCRKAIRLKISVGYFMPFSTCWIIFLTIWPPIEPAWRDVRSPL